MSGEDKILERLTRIETILEGNVDLSKITISFKGMMSLFLILIISGVIPAVANYYALSSKFDILSEKVTHHIADDRVHCGEKK